MAKNIKIKDTNPKDSVGSSKLSFSVIPCQVLGELALGLMEGDRKYSRHNYRIAGVRASIYYDACLRHLMAWWEGEDIDEDSGLNHVTKAIAGLIVLRDSMIMENWTDDRPPKSKQGWVKELNEKVEKLIEKYPDRKIPYTELNSSEAVITDDNIDVTTDGGNCHTNAGEDIIKVGDLVKLVKTGLIGWESQDWAQQLGYNKSYEVDSVNLSDDFPLIRVKFDDYSTSFDFHPDHVEKIN